MICKDMVSSFREAEYELVFTRIIQKRSPIVHSFSIEGAGRNTLFEGQRAMTTPRQTRRIPVILIFHRNISFSTVFFAQGAVVVLGGRQPAFALRLAPHKNTRRLRLYESFLLNFSISCAPSTFASSGGLHYLTEQLFLQAVLHQKARNLPMVSPSGT
jgi:hypothetical protein